MTLACGAAASRSWSDSPVVLRSPFMAGLGRKKKCESQALTKCQVIRAPDIRGSTVRFVCTLQKNQFTY